VFQAVESLPSRHEAMSSNSSTTTKKETKKTPKHTKNYNGTALQAVTQRAEISRNFIFTNADA
jgi:hypothetical protein